MSDGGGPGDSTPSGWHTTLIGRIGIVVAAVLISTALVTSAYIVRGSSSASTTEAASETNVSHCINQLQKADSAIVEDAGNSNLKVVAAAYRIFPDQSPPLIKRVGGIIGKVDHGRHLWLVSKSLGSSHDTANPPNAGTDRYYAIGELLLDQHGCWSAETNTGYDQAIGLVYRDTVVDVDDQTSSLFSAPSPEALRDGFDPHILQAQNATIIASYDVSTA